MSDDSHLYPDNPYPSDTVPLRMDIVGPKKPNDVLAIIDALTEPQRDVLGQIAMNFEHGHDLAVVESLLKLGLVVPAEEITPRGRLLHAMVPLPVHMAWCEWCSRQPELVEEAERA